MVTLTLKKVQGRLEFIPPKETNERMALVNILQLCRERHNDFVTLTFSVPKKKRTLSQNSALHGFSQCIAEYTGEDMESVKLYCKKRAIRRGYPVKKDTDGNVIVSKLDGEPIPESSANVSTVELGYVLDELMQLAAELEIILPLTQAEIKEKEGV